MKQYIKTIIFHIYRQYLIWQAQRTLLRLPKHFPPPATPEEAQGDKAFNRRMKQIAKETINELLQ